MTLWIIQTVMIAAAAVLIAAPFIRKFERSRLTVSGDVAVYRDQLKEVETELSQGLIDQVQAEGALVEINRRILAAGRADTNQDASLTPSERNFAVTAVTAIVIFGSIALYAVVGSPELPSAARANGDQPSAASNNAPGMRSTAPDDPVQRLATATTGASNSPSSNQAQTGLPPVEEMIQRVQARLQRNPQDTEGWRLLGWSLFNVERFTDAAQAYSKAVELRPEIAEYRSARGESRVREADGTVTPDARKDFDEAIRLDPRDSRARFFVGLAKEQDGDKAGAIADWSAVIADADPNEPWLSDLRQRLADLRGETGAAGSAAPAPAAPKLSSDAMQEFLQSEKAKSDAAGPRPEDVRNAEKMAPQDRMAMIRGMVEGLATRLAQSPRDADGWIKLIRSRVVLGDAEQARQSLRQALETFPEDGPERTRIVDAAKQLGLEQTEGAK